MIQVKTHSKLIGSGLYAKHLCTQAEQVRTTVIARRQRKAVTVYTRKPMVLEAH